MEQVLATILLNACDSIDLPAELFPDQENPGCYKLTVTATWGQFVSALVQSDELAYSDDDDNRLFCISDIVINQDAETFTLS